MEKELITGIVAISLLVGTCSAILITKGIKENKGNTSSSITTSDKNYEAGVYFIANGGTLSKLGNYTGGDSSITSFKEFSTEGNTYIDFSMDRYIPVRKGYTFGGWYSSPDLNDESKLTGKLLIENEVKRIYAYWKEEDKPSLYGYTVTSSYVSIHGFSNYISSNVYNLKFPSFIEGYPVRYISTNSDYVAFTKPNVISVKLPENLKYLYGGTFTSSNISELYIPASVTTIGSNAFSSCKQLKTVTIEENNASLNTIGNYAFYNDPLLETINIPSSVTSIEEAAFKDCTILENITIPETVTSIGKKVLSGTEAEKNLKKVNDFVFINDTSIYEYTGEEVRITIPKEAKTLCNSLFEGNTSLLSVEFEKDSKLASINSRVFFGCSSIEDPIVLPNSLKTIGNYAFDSVPANIDASLCSFDSNAIPSSSFEGALSKEIKIPLSTKTIKNYAFRKCVNLESFDIPNGVTSLQSSVFANCTSLKNIVLPESLTSIQNSVFLKCTSLEEIVIPSNVTSIYSSLFEGCTNLKSVTLNPNITSIGNMAFKDCTSLISIEFDLDSKTFSSIGNRVFEGWTSSQTVTFKGIDLKTIESKNKPATYTIDSVKVECDWKHGCDAKVIFK